jgi:hypothetical protein
LAMDSHNNCDVPLNRSSNLVTVVNYTRYNCATFYIQLSLVVTILLKIRWKWLTLVVHSLLLQSWQNLESDYFLFAIVLSTLLRFTASDYTYGIFKFFLTLISHYLLLQSWQNEEMWKHLKIVLYIYPIYIRSYNMT